MAKTKTIKPKTAPAANEVSLRDGFGSAIVKLGKANPDILCLCADLTESVRMQDFADKFPERYFQTGIAEQNMAGIATGLALTGKVPFIGSFACFQPYRNLDQIRTSICIMNANVKIVSSHSGFSYAADGIQIQALEDVGIMRMLPNMTVLVPGDANQAAEMTQWAAEVSGPVYLRLGREKSAILPNATLKLGKAQELRHGTDVTIIANGYMVAKVLEAAELLAQDGVFAQVLNMHTVKPLDAEAILSAAKTTGRIVTVEEHQVAGGLGSAVAEVVAQSGLPVKMRILGVEDKFGQTAKTSAELWNLYKLTPAHIRQAVRQLTEQS